WTDVRGVDMLRLRPGNYSLSFSDVPGFSTPDPQTIRIFAGEVLEYSAQFNELCLLSVNTDPYLPSTIYVNGAGRNEGSLYVYVPAGKYDITFRSVPDYHVPVPDMPEVTLHLLPWAASCIASGGVILATRRKGDLPHKGLSTLLAAIGLTISFSGLTWVGLGEMGVGFGWDSDWIHPLSLVGLSLGLFAFGVLQAYSDRRMKGAFVLAALVPVPLVASPFADLNPLTFSSLLLGLYVVAGLLAGVSAGMMHGSFKHLALLQVSTGIDARGASRVTLALKGLGSLASALVVLTGVLAYLVGHWTTHWMGTSSFGSDVLSELFYGAKTSIIVGIFSAIIASVLGALVGLYSGYVGGWKDEVIMRANDVVLSIPWLVLMIIVAAMLQKIDLTGIILIIGLTGWSATARMVRAQVLSLRERQFIERARAIGSSDLGIIRRHILPNSFPLVFANTILTVAVSILSEATLSFLGMRPVGVVTWGTMLDYAQAANAFSIGLSAWIVAPGLCIVLIVLGFSLLGYVLDDILNPKLRKR
ncbi:MAG: ABC transporter permease, partial [Candidatus Thermoplasmatota archaeon]|nr:ABC transporter permease [Candidatus Thermoplasmatota archaeon]